MLCREFGWTHDQYEDQPGGRPHTASFERLGYRAISESRSLARTRGLSRLLALAVVHRGTFHRSLPMVAGVTRTCAALTSSDGSVPGTWPSYPPVGVCFLTWAARAVTREHDQDAGCGPRPRWPRASSMASLVRSSSSGHRWA